MTDQQRARVRRLFEVAESVARYRLARQGLVEADDDHWRQYADLAREHIEDLLAGGDHLYERAELQALLVLMPSTFAEIIRRYRDERPPTSGLSSIASWTHPWEIQYPSDVHRGISMQGQRPQAPMYSAHRAPPGPSPGGITPRGIQLRESMSIS